MIVGKQKVSFGYWGLRCAAAYDPRSIIDWTPGTGCPNIHILNPAFAASIAPTPILTAAQAGIPQSLRFSVKTDFQPRIGAAWRPFGNNRTVIRGGFGRFIAAPLGELLGATYAIHSADQGEYFQTIANGVPSLAFPHPFPANLAVPGSQYFQQASNLHYLDPSLYQWNLTFERVRKDKDEYHLAPPKFVVINLDTKAVEKSFNFPKGYDQGFGFLSTFKVSPDSKYLYVFDRDIKIVDLATFTIVDSIPLSKPPYPGASPYRLAAVNDPNDDKTTVSSVFVSVDPIVHKGTSGSTIEVYDAKTLTSDKVLLVNKDLTTDIVTLANKDASAPDSGGAK